MSNFNKIFFAVKKQCNTATNIYADINKISDETKMHPQSVEYYMNCLAEIGLMEYCKDKGSFLLTERGKTKERVFPEYTSSMP